VQEDYYLHSMVSHVQAMMEERRLVVYNGAVSLVNLGLMLQKHSYHDA
jgi:hypothetical protein